MTSEFAEAARKRATQTAREQKEKLGEEEYARRKGIAGKQGGWPKGRPRGKRKEKGS
jgi:hypothetical protein